MVDKLAKLKTAKETEVENLSDAIALMVTDCEAARQEAARAEAVSKKILALISEN